MPENDSPTGELFSRVYIDRGTPTNDSVRMRTRLAAYLEQNIRDDRDHFALVKFIEKEGGITVPWRGISRDISGLFARESITTVLDLITIVGRWAGAGRMGLTGQGLKWREFVRRVFMEEHVSYELDDACGVHYRPDEDYQRNRISMVAALQPTRYRAVLEAVNTMFARFDEHPPNGKDAIRSAAEAIETLGKLIVANDQIARLGSSEIERRLKPKVLAYYSSDSHARDAAGQLLTGLIDWTNAAHQYRHGQEREEPLQPPLELAVSMISAATGYLRWLATIDQTLRTRVRTQLGDSR